MATRYLLTRCFAPTVVEPTDAHLASVNWQMTDDQRDFKHFGLEIDCRRFERAGTLLNEALQESMDLADQRMVARCLERLSYLAAAQG
ncbi:MAG TPA: hypothetical protein VKQ30_12410 [Ktedonobacterales bacterium]|nr:hypothetical protein [Ktedonobacterales bacterium]